MKRAIVGGPHTGKTTRAGDDARHSDDVVALGWGWHAQAEYVANLFDRVDGTVEGVTVTRGLRKWLGRNPEGKPVEEIIRLEEPYGDLTRGQESMRKGEQTVWREIEPELQRRGVRIRYE